MRKKIWILYQKFLSDILLLNSKFRIEKFNIIKLNLKAHFISKIFLLLDKENKNIEETSTLLKKNKIIVKLIGHLIIYWKNIN